jgi:hypothetical protein
VEARIMNLRKGFVASKILLMVLIIIAITVLPVYGESGDKNDKEKSTEEKKSSQYYYLKKSEEVTVTATLTPQLLKDCTSSVIVSWIKTVLRFFPAEVR